MIKLLRWQEDGFILYQKRLEDGTFELPRFNPREDWNKIEWKTFMDDHVRHLSEFSEVQETPSFVVRSIDL